MWTVNATAKYGYETPVCPNGFFFSYPTNPVEMKALADALIYDRAQTVRADIFIHFLISFPLLMSSSTSTCGSTSLKYPRSTLCLLHRWTRSPSPTPLTTSSTPTRSAAVSTPPYFSSSVFPAHWGFLLVAIAEPFTTSFPSSSMVPHRFCGLASDASNYDCDWSAYPGDVLSRSIGILVIAGVGLLLFIAAFVYAGAFHTKACADNKGRQDKDEEMGEKKSRKGEKKAVNVKAESNKSKLAWLYLILPIAVMMYFLSPLPLFNPFGICHYHSSVGGVLLLMSNGKITSAFVEVEVEFTHRRSAMIEMIDTIKSSPLSVL